MARVRPGEYTREMPWIEVAAPSPEGPREPTLRVEALGGRRSVRQGGGDRA